MKYTYAYKSADGVRHESVIESTSRDEAFAELRRQGIRPIKVVAADGAKANGEIRGVRKRVVATIVVIAILAVAGVVVNSQHTISQKNRQIAQASKSETSAPRHQIYGDPVIIEELEHGKFDAILPRKGDQYLAWFAQPGRLMAPKGLTIVQLRNFTDAQVEAIMAVASEGVAISEQDSREARELKQIVNGMRDELREYLANGNGTARSYTRRLFERLQQEMQIYERTKAELEREKSSEAWDKKNEELRRMGLRTIPNPKESD